MSKGSSAISRNFIPRLENANTNRDRSRDLVSSFKGMGEELSKIALETASKENATYTDFRLVNSRNEPTQVVNDNPSSEELNSLWAGDRGCYADLAWYVAV